MALATARELKFCFTESISVTFLKAWCTHKQTQVFQCLVVHQCFVDHFFVRRFRSLETHSLFPLFSIDSRPNTSSVPNVPPNPGFSMLCCSSMTQTKAPTTRHG